MKKNLLILISLLIILVFVYLMCSRDKAYVLPNHDDLLARQSEVDKYIKDVSNDETYKLENPKIINNPYFISPLTSLIIFSSDVEINVSVLINDKLYECFKGTNFIIPIVHLVEGTDNKIDLVSNGAKYTYFIKTDDISKGMISESGKCENNILISSTKMKNFMMNGEGKLIWYLDLDTQGLIEEVSSDTFLIGTEESIQNDLVSTFTGIYEIDYLGKIIKRIDTPYGYHHEIKYIGNNRALVLGSDIFPMDTVYELDITSGDIKNVINIHSLLSMGSPDLKEYLSSIEYGIETNSVDYLNGNVLLSLRNLNTVMEFSYDTKEINYIITGDKTIKKYLSKYVIDSDVILMGEHNARYISEDVISLYNNGYDHSSRNSSSASGQILKIGDRVKLLRSYEYEDKHSYAFGSMDVSDSGTLVNYPYMYQKRPSNHITYDKYYTNLVIYDGNKYKARFKINDNLYRAKVFDINMSGMYKISDFSYRGNSLAREKIKIDKYEEFRDILNISNNSIELMIDTSNKDIEVIFKGKNTYTLKYLNTKTYFSLDAGVYQIFIKINGKYYKYKNSVKFF